MGIIFVLAAIGISTLLLWIIIYFVTGNSYQRWGEFFIWALFFTLMSVSSNFFLIFSNDKIFLLSIFLLSHLIIGILLYFLLDFRLGIPEVKKKMTIAGVFVGVMLIFGLLFY